MLKNNWKSFLAWEKSTQDTIDFKKCYVDMIGEKGDLMAGLLLSQIVYWYLPNKEGKSKLRVKKEGHFWLAKEAREWYEEIRFSEANYKTAIKKLVQQKLIVKKVFKFDNKTTTHIRLNIPVFLDKLNKTLSVYEDQIDDENTEFEQYINEEMNEKTPSEPNGDMGLVESTNPEWSNQPIQNGRINQSRTVESTVPITESTTKISTEIITKNLSISEKVEKSNLPVMIKEFLKAKSNSDRLIHLKLTVQDVEENFLLYKDDSQVGTALYLRALDYTLGNKTIKTTFAQVMSKNISTQQKWSQQNKTENNNNHSKEVIPDWFGHQDHQNYEEKQTPNVDIRELERRIQRLTGND